MSASDTGLERLQTSLPRIISPSTHGIIDYAHAAFFFSVGLFCSRSNKRAAAAAYATSGFVLVQSLLTDYRFGVKPLLSFENHGKIDGAFASGSWLLPVIFGFRGTPAARIFEINSAVEGSVVAMTDWSNERAKSERKEQ